ncbi:hypothetical protein A2Z61_01145 [Candidatus Campbellbacteria bacterium RIFCSPLOWO2_02_35_12]|uniref:Uncharacterized protein n=1 Tax=Candidatus Campbellbacteria bacterium RIFCSPLOWO2_02_35_12 TaxID=1797580 RepID=A0A1F5EG41_9BACT|nr:MAG: hypothetical protein A2Z61_01145 [Candidatus Campbellbacteria bacterium RIFCSPLOWO2_02_35_12]
MPTGYTADLNDGKEVTFKEFAMKCAQAFDVKMRNKISDTDTDADEFHPTGHNLYEKALVERHLAEIERWSNARAEREAKKYFDIQALSRKEEGSLKFKRVKRAYLAMLKEVKEWEPPTKDHKKLKIFMVEQLKKSIEADCSYVPRRPLPLRRLSGKSYRAQLVKRMQKEIAYYSRNHVIEVQLAREKSEWARALRHSLNDSK